MTNLGGGTFRVLLSLNALVLIAVALASGSAFAQGFKWPEEPENLQVLPEGTGGAQLGKIMRGFASSLGVRCEHCHVGEGPDLTQFDFPSDEKATKLKARLMIAMVTALNQEHLPKLSEIEDREKPILQVECMTCHRSLSRPVMLGDVLSATIESEGVDAAIAEYRDLRDEYYGGFSYDFSEGMLTGLGEQLGDDGDFESAIRLIELEIEMNGESAAILYTLGGVQAAADLTIDAIDSFSNGMDMAPNDWKPFFQSELDRLTNRLEQGEDP